MCSKLIIITGLPATGKTTIGKYLADRLNYVFLSKNALKESLFDSLGVRDHAWSQRLGSASYSQLYMLIDELLSKKVSVVVETNFVSEYDSPRFQSLVNKHSPQVTQFLCFAAGEILYQRFIDRAYSTKRHEGHKDQDSVHIYKKALLSGKAKPLVIGSSLIEVDTTDWSTVDLDFLLERIR